MSVLYYDAMIRLAIVSAIVQDLAKRQKAALTVTGGRLSYDITQEAPELRDNLNATLGNYVSCRYTVPVIQVTQGKTDAKLLKIAQQRVHEVLQMFKSVDRVSPQMTQDYSNILLLKQALNKVALS